MDLTPFEEINSLGKVPWAKRLELIQEQFPTSLRLDWHQAFEDVDLFGRILRDILKVDQSEPGRSGPRPVLDRKKAQQRLRQFMGRDFSEFPFQEAFRTLAAGRSVRQLATKTGIDRNMIQKLLTGQKDPDLYFLEEIAKAFDKHPSYFLEYRMAFVIGALSEKMAASPEITVDLYKRLRRDGSNRGSE